MTLENPCTVSRELWSVNRVRRDKPVPCWTREGMRLASLWLGNADLRRDSGP